MSENNENSGSFFDKLKKKRQITVVDEHSYEHRWSTQLSILNIFTLLGLIAIVFMALTYILLAFTPLSYLVTGNDNHNYKKEVVALNKQMDSLMNVSVMQSRYYNRMLTHLSGKSFKEDTLYKTKIQPVIEDTTLELDPTEADSIFRTQMQIQSSPKSFQSDNNAVSIQGVFFLSPLSGQISQSFSVSKNHLGTDIIGKKNESVKAAVDGTVIYTGYTVEDGNIILIAHPENIVTVYKHNKKILKKAGQAVKAGDPIAIIGNTGENTSGYHVHFEIWHNGRAVNPENYISF